ncbi:MAG: PHP domain-containing protein [Candidatus Helarchaeota archaeon]
MYLDLHIHSNYSFDSFAKPKKIIRIAKRNGLSAIAITDHNTIRGAVKAKRLNRDKDLQVIIGTEIGTEAGDIVGLFIENEIQSRSSINVIDEIHQQGGVTFLPHPFKSRKWPIDLVKLVDLIEAFNSRASKEQNIQALNLAKRLNKPIVGGSDAHFYSEIGLCKSFYDSENIRELIMKNPKKIEIKYTSTHLIFASQLVKFIKLRKLNKIPFQIIPILKNWIQQIPYHIDVENYYFSENFR